MVITVLFQVMNDDCDSYCSLSMYMMCWWYKNIDLVKNVDCDNTASCVWRDIIPIFVMKEKRWVLIVISPSSNVLIPEEEVFAYLLLKTIHHISYHGHI